MRENMPADEMTMSDVVISVSDVSKIYKLYPSHQDRLKEALHPFRKHYHEQFSVLSGVSFEIRRGESVGILGRNGAGKSTLLQLIAGVLNPTGGIIRVVGKVAALLELGAGFNPDLTGRENVILASTIQGIAENEIAERVSAVEAFADVGVFFDQPMKVYSSGMYARVAFANAIHVDPDVLIVDEILGVGDAKFQEKCYSKIQSMREAGVCILFVSHSTDVVQRNCQKALLLENGKIVAKGAADVVVAVYHDLLYGSGCAKQQEVAEIPKQLRTTQSASFNFELENYLDELRLSGDEALCRSFHYYNTNERRFGNGDAKITDFLITADGRANLTVLSGNEALSIYLKVRFMKEITRPELGWAVASPEGIVIAGSNTALSDIELPKVKAGETCIYEVVIQPMLCGGDYFLNFGIGEIINGAWSFLDNRKAVAHLSVAHQNKATGFFNVPFKCLVISGTDNL
ncbi:MAG: ABC transporter ATP-binding protein [Methylococcaceae bacterium]|jgi:lipopolysaccharide transport system ATP-binding protein